MRTALRPRYYCDHCNKGNGSPSAMRRHERGCTLNPQRVCGMCAKLAEEGGPEQTCGTQELLAVLDAQGFKAMCLAANDCPACILAALRSRNVQDDENGGYYVPGPEDGRNEWSYAQAKKAWWDDWNSAQAERNYPGY